MHSANQDQNALNKEPQTNSVGYYCLQQELLMEISGLLNGSMELDDFIFPILSKVGRGFRVEGLLFHHVEPSKGKINYCWGVCESISTQLKEFFASQEGEYFLNLFEPTQLYRVCHNYDIFKNFSSLSSSAKQIIESLFPCAILSLPVSRKGELYGHLVFHTKDLTRTFSPEEVTTLEMITQQICLVLCQNQLQQRLSDLEAENQQLQKIYQNKNDYLDYMTHELRTPLSSVLGFSKMLREEIYGPLNDKQKQYVNGIADSGKHLLALVNDCLDLSKIEAEREEIYLENIAVEDLCQSAISMVDLKAKEQKLSLIVDIGDNVDFCRVDQRRIKQILLNLLSNAIKFTEKGSITLQVRSDRDYITFCVIDTGIGITDGDQKKLFQPFQQIQSHLSRRHKGTGLGLTLSRKLAQLHGGDLTLTSEIGKGSCFTLQLPINLENRK